MSMILQGLLVDLVPATHEFHDKMYTFWNNESRLWATMGDNGPISHDSIKRIIEHRSGAAERGYSGLHFMMKAKDGNIIGNIGLNWVDYYNRYASMGSWIGEPDYWGGGHGTDALLLLCDYAFRWLDLRRLTLSTMGINERAQGNVENCGFIREGLAREATFVQGQRVDEVMYGMMREEWRGRDVLVETLKLREKAEKRYGKSS